MSSLQAICMSFLSLMHLDKSINRLEWKVPLRWLKIEKKRVSLYPCFLM